jgi:hypothetical protein
MPLVRRSAFLTAGCPENGEDHNRGVVVRSFFGSVCMTCGAWPPCHKVGTLVHVGGGGGLILSPPQVRLPTSEVVASTGETVSATCRRTPGSLALMASLSPPRRETGRGSFRSGVRVEVVTTASESSMQRQTQPLVLRWSPPLASRLELAIPRSYRCGGSSYLQSRDGTRAPLKNKCNTFAFCKVPESLLEGGGGE